MSGKPLVVGLRTDSFVHVGVGQSFGEVDLPFVREPATGYPFIPGSALKGALRRAFWEDHPHWGEETDAETGKKKAIAGKDEKQIFGDTDAAAGRLLVGDARLVFLPVRSLGLGFRYLTCPTLLARVLRDLDRCTGAPAVPTDVFTLGPADSEKAVCLEDDDRVYLEEYRFARADTDSERDDILPQVFARIIETLLEASAAEHTDLQRRIVMVTDDAFATFARYALPVRMRNKLDGDKLVEVGALWSEEYLAPETVLYMLLADRRAAGDTREPIGAIRGLFAQRGGYLQVGGNETVGQGVIRFRLPPEPAS